jgi:hypothetical protein
MGAVQAADEVLPNLRSRDSCPTNRSSWATGINPGIRPVEMAAVDSDSNRPIRSADEILRNTPTRHRGAPDRAARTTDTVVRPEDCRQRFRRHPTGPRTADNRGHRDRRPDPLPDQTESVAAAPSHLLR